MAANPRIDDLRKRLEKEPGSRLFAQLAEELRKDGELEEAIRVARDGLQKHPAYPSARMTLGRALLDTGDWSAARGEFELVLKSAADNILASRYLAECLENLGQRDAAIAQYKKTLAMAPGEKHVIARLQELEGTGGAAKAPPAAAAAAFAVRPAAGLRPATARPDTGSVARPAPAAPAPPPVPAAPPTPPPPIPLATVEGEMEIETSRASSAPVAARGSDAPSGATPSAPFAPIPLVEADEEFELERPYESPTTGIGLGSPPAAEARPAAPAVPPAAARPVAPPPAEPEDQEFELEAPHEAPSVGWAATIRPLPVVDEPAPTRAIAAPEAPAAAAPPPAVTPAPPPVPPPPAAVTPPPKPQPAQPIIPSTLTSPTLGELYFNQGFTDKAIEVYRDLVAREPENQRLGARLQELEKIQRSLSGGAAAAPPTPAPMPVPPPPPPVSAAPPPPPPLTTPPTPPPAPPPAAAAPAPAETAVLEPLSPPPAPTGEGSRREAIERTIARLEGLLAAIRKG